jgi:sodium-dependent phosphate transporter
MYLWILIAGGINSFIDACGIGANDLANSFGTTYGSKVLTLTQIVGLASVFEFGGAMLLGAPVTNTLAGSISNVAYFKSQPYVLMYGMLCALAASSTWLFTATYLGLPVSTTHSIVGGIMGFSLVYKGVDGVVWNKSLPDFPYVAGFVPIVISWISSPIISALMSAGFYSLIKYFVFKSTHGVWRSIHLLPFVVFVTFFIESFFILSKGAGSKITWPIETTSWVSICVATGASLLSALAIPWLTRKVTDIPVLPEAVAPLEVETAVTEYDPKVEYTFKYLQIFTSICTSFAHGANDVSNAVGPLAAIYYIYQNDAVASKIEVPLWILALGGSGIVVGLATYGKKIMEVLGEKITFISPARGFSAELATALVVSFASKYGFPISSTQCITGAVIGISFCDHDFKNVNWRIMARIFLSWIGTILVTAGLSAAIFSQGVYSPNV